MIVHRVEHNRRRLPMHVHICESAVERSRGLLLRRCPDRRTAFMIHSCSVMHTVGMLFRIDVLFCDESGRILRIVENMKPWRMAKCPGANLVWELRAGGACEWGWRVGDRIRPC